MHIISFRILLKSYWTCRERGCSKLYIILYYDLTKYTEKITLAYTLDVLAIYVNPDLSDVTGTYPFKL